jgi:acyl-CoA reductase-like NAD-dependent aldehyde dehydrogenase
VTTPEVLRPVDPATGLPLDPVPVTTQEELRAAVSRARAAAPGWGGLPLEERIDAVRRFAQCLTDPEIADDLAHTVSREMGKPIRHARAEVHTVATRTETYFERVREACREEVGREGAVQVVTQWRPLGVAAVVGPWNFPVSTPHTLVVSALLTGNTCVFKPSELTPHTGARYARLLAARLPPGVLECVQGGGALGAALVADAVDMVAFTGSIRTGQAIMREAAGGMKRLVLELGGKDPCIVLVGADVAAAAAHVARSALSNSGQVCVAAERILVQREIHDAFVEALVQEVRKFKVGDPSDPATDLGPMASPAQRALVQEHIREARAAGARVLIEGQAREPGFWLEPTVLDGIHADMRVAREETFGPVVAIETVADEEEAIRRANATQYGLGASIWGAPGERLDALAGRIEAGMVGINRGLSAAAGAPWVGWKMSGFGYTRSAAGMRQFMVPRTLSRVVT